MPRRLVGHENEFGPVPLRLSPVFRDHEELATATNLGETLTRALQESAAQIVVCSPAAAQSRWVNEEILNFKRLGREHRIFCLIVSGEPSASARPDTTEQECFPSALIQRMGPDGQLTEARFEPIAADVRPGKDRRSVVTAAQCCNLAFVLYRQGKHEAAMEMLRDVLEMRRRALGSDHPDVAAAGTSLAYWLPDANRYDEAAALVEEGLAIRERPRRAAS